MSRFNTQQDRLDYLLQELKEDSVQYRTMEVADRYEDKRMAVRSLMNIRAPQTIPPDLLDVQDAFLTMEAKEKGIVTVSDIPTVKAQFGSRHAYGDRISIWQGDITRLAVDAIVNAANSQMLGCFIPCHKCIDNAIHSAAGMQLREECHQEMNRKRIRFGARYEEPTGQAMLTKGYNLPAKYVIHTVGPIVGHYLTKGVKEDLANCYRNVLQCCMDNGLRTVAFCCISTGEFHFPNGEAANIAVNTVHAVLKRHENQFDRVIFNVFKDIDRQLYETLLQ